MRNARICDSVLFTLYLYTCTLRARNPFNFTSKFFLLLCLIIPYTTTTNQKKEGKISLGGKDYSNNFSLCCCIFDARALEYSCTHTHGEHTNRAQ